MTDLEFLSTNKSVSKKTFLYSWEEGILRPEMRTSILRKARGFLLETPCDIFLETVSKSSLFEERFFFISVQEAKELSALLRGLQKVQEDRVCVFAPVSISEKILSEYKIAQVVQEATKTKPNFGSACAYLLQKAGDPEVLLKLPFLKQNIEELYAKSADLSDFLQRGEFALFSCLETDPFRWNKDLCRTLLPQNPKTQYFLLHEKIYYFLTQPTNSTKESLFSFLKEQSSQGSHRAATASLFRALFDLVEVNAEVGTQNPEGDFKAKVLSKFKHIPCFELLRMLSRFSEKEYALNTQDFLYTLEIFLQEMLKVVAN